VCDDERPPDATSHTELDVANGVGALIISNLSRMKPTASDVINECERLALRLDADDNSESESAIMVVVRDLVATVEQLDVAAAEESLREIDARGVVDGERRLNEMYAIARTVLQTFIADPRQFVSTSARLPALLAQPTFQEAKRVARGLALGPTGVGWQELLGEFALVHDEKDDRHKLRLEGGLIPQWWGRPSDIASLRRELAETGHDGIALLFLGVALVLHSDEGHVDVEIDELIARMGVNPRSTAERAEARLHVWRILTLLGGMRVIGARRSVVRDGRKNVHLESDDALLAVGPWRPVGSQIPLDPGIIPLKVTISSSPWLARLRGNRAALQDFGNMLAISEIPIGQPSGAWARAIGLALQQFWREKATHATRGRAGDDHRPTIRFPMVTRRELLEMFPPRPSASDVLEGKHPSRAIDYWDAAIAILSAKPKDESRQSVIAFFDGYSEPARNWQRDRPRKGWAQAWLDEGLDIRPPADAVLALGTIAKVAKMKRQQNSKLAQSRPPQPAPPPRLH
jgi:hypothetical protein